MPRGRSAIRLHFSPSCPYHEALEPSPLRALPMSDAAATAGKIIANIEKVIIGKRQQLVLSLVTCFSEGHLLLEDVPGVAKTMLARAPAPSIGCVFKRVQCTPDLLPTDVTRVSGFHPKTAQVAFPPR